MKFKVSGREVLNKSKDMETEHGKMSSIMQNIDSQVKTMLATWEGQASDTFKVKFNALRPNVDTYLGIAKKYSKWLEQLATNYITTETTVATEQNRLKTSL